MSTTIPSYMINQIVSLSTEQKLELISWISNELKNSLLAPKASKEELLQTLSGAWSDTGDDLASDILSNRSVSLKDLDLE